MSELYLLESTLATLRVGVLAVDASGCVELQNPEASRILGISAAATLGRPLKEIFSSDHPLSMLVSEVLTTGRDLSINAAQIPERTGDEVLSVDISGTPRSEAQEGVVVMLHDRTIGRKLEDMAAERARSMPPGPVHVCISHVNSSPIG